MNIINEDVDDNDCYTMVEPSISYYSSSSNRGVGTLISSRQKRTIKLEDSFFAPSSSNNSFSLYNTIMLPTITTEESIENTRSIDNIQEKEKNQIFLKKDITKYISSNIEIKNNEEIIQHKDYFLLDKNISYNNKVNNSDNHIKKIKRINTINNEYLNNKRILNANNNESQNSNNNKNFEDPSDYLLKGKSFRMNHLTKSSIFYKTIHLKENNKNKSKNRLLELKINNHNKNKKIHKYKNQASLEKSKSLIDEANIKKTKKDKMDFALKNKTTKNCNNFLNHNKKSEKVINENNFKKAIKKIIIAKNNENEDENKIKNEKRKALKKEDTKKDIKSSKLKNIIENYNKTKLNKSFHIRSNFNMMKENSKNKDYDNDNMENENNEIEKNLNIEEEKSTKEKGKKVQEKKSNLRLDNEKEEIEKTLTFNSNNNLRKKTFSKELFIKKIKIYKKETSELSQKLKNKKEKNKDKENNKNSFSRKEFYFNSFRNMNINETKIKKLKIKSENVLEKQRNNSFYLEKPKIEKDIESKKNDNVSINRSEKESKIKKKTNKKIPDFVKELQNNKQKIQVNLFSKDKFTNTEFIDSDYLKYTLNCMDLILDINMEKQTRLKNKINFNFPNPKKKKIEKKIEKKIALFDLDETLVHCTGDIKTTKEKYQNVIDIKLPGKQEIQVGINVRPYWKQTLNLIKKNYYIVVYTASHQAYADAVLDFMDPKKKFFKYRLYRNNCSLIDVDGEKFYVKDLEILNQNYNLKDIVIIDNSVLSFAYHLHNGIPIIPYYDEDKDGSLYVVGLYLMHIFKENDLREENKKHINLDSFLEEAKKEKEEDNNIDESDDSMDIIKDIEKDNGIKDKNDIKNGENNSLKEDSNKKISEKKVTFLKKESISHFSTIKRKQSQVFDNYKLKSRSKLLNMYYEVNDDSPKSEHFNSKKSMLFNLKRESVKELDFDENNEKEEGKNNKKKEATIIFVDNKEEIDCKSDHFFINEQNLPNCGSKDDDKKAILKRGFTIKEDLFHNIKDDKNSSSRDKKSKNINHKLGFIRSNFYNTFKI